MSQSPNSVTIYSQAFELAQHFLSMAGADLSKVGREEFVPAKEFQMRWCRAYLGGYKNIPEHKVSCEFCVTMMSDDSFIYV